jgi:amino acid transporter
MVWAGPIEISTGELILVFLVLAAMALAIPALAGVIAVVVYRRDTPENERSRRQATITFFRTAALALLAQVVLSAVVGGIQELIG